MVQGNDINLLFNSSYFKAILVSFMCIITTLEVLVLQHRPLAVVYDQIIYHTQSLSF